MKSKPNIVIFNPDQWRGDVMGHLGNHAAATPHIDEFVSSCAVSFRSAFCQNPVCTPSRCSFMTGLYPHVRGHRTMFHMLHAEHGEKNLLSVLRENGYTVWWGGKNDLVPGGDDFLKYCDVKFNPHDAAFLKRHGISAVQKDSHTDSESWRGPAGGDNYYSFFRGLLTPSRPGEQYIDSDWCSILGAADFIRAASGDGPPFCIYLPLSYPHPPYAVEEPFFSMTDRGRLPPRITAHKDRGPAILSAIRERQNLRSWTEDRWNELRAVYYGMCSRLDRQFSIILGALKESGTFDNTMIFLFSDHGDYTGDYGLVEKAQNSFEDCLTRVPLIVKPPADTDIVPGIRNGLVELVDVSETIFDILGIDPGYDRFGKSLAPLFSRDIPFRTAVFCEGGRLTGETQCMERESPSSADTRQLYWPRVSLQCDDSYPWHGKAMMCRTERFKYVLRLYEEDELYDLARDPEEITNLCAAPAYAGVLAELRNTALRWMVETADIVPRRTDRR